MGDAMARAVDIDLFEIGHCRHLERLTLRGGGWRTCRFPALAVLILHPEERPILYDTGYADHFLEATNPFPERFYRWLTPMTLPPGQRLAVRLKQHGVGLEDVGRVLISHLHADHVAGLRDLPRARFVALRDDVETARRLGRLSGLRKAHLPAMLPDDFASRLDLADDRPLRTLGSEWAPFTHGFDLIGDGSVMGVALPGHTAAQMGLAVRGRDGRRCFFAADACWSGRAIRERRPPPSLVRTLMHDWQAYRATFDRLTALAIAQPDLPIVPSHCAASIANLREMWSLPA
jgi:glyoxylase-like metal-dependent hydrolase (beta-lactamase superfamily II)